MTEYAGGLPLEIRSWSDDERTFTARVCNYGIPDSKGTSWAPGAFANSLRSKLPKAVWSHDWTKPIGSVIGYDDQPTHLDVQVKLADFDAVPDARTAHSLLKDGHVDEFSFGFFRVSDKADPNHRGVTMITEAEMKEVSPVLVGSVPGTRTLAVRTADGGIDVIERPVEETLTMTQVQKMINDALASTRTAFTEADAPKNSAGTVSMKRTPHKYSPTNGDGSVCKTCGGQHDAKAHTRDGMSTVELRDLVISMAGDPAADADTNDLIAACDAAIDQAIALASYQDMTQLPPWVAQMLALVMAADACIDQAMEQLDIDDPLEQDQNIAMARSFDLGLIETRATDAGAEDTDGGGDLADGADDETRAVLDRLGSLAGRHTLFESRASVPVPKA